nr:MAG TPA: hypothetical protein [Caudoviricetes sp.]
MGSPYNIFLKILRFGGSIPPVRFGKAWCCLI